MKKERKEKKLVMDLRKKGEKVRSTSKNSFREHWWGGVSKSGTCK